jgi:hypothetical protein
MKKNNFLLGLILTILFVQCAQKEEPQEVNVLKEKIHASKDFKDYESTTQQLMESITNGEISLKGADKVKATLAAKKVKSINDLTKSFEEAGIKGAKKYAELLFNQHQSMLNIIKNNPELKKLKAVEMTEILKMSIKPNINIPPKK